MSATATTSATVSDSPSLGDDVSYTPILSTDRVGLSVQF